MNQKSYLVVSGTIFGIIAVLHLLRGIYGWPAQIGAFAVPTWASWVALLIAGYLAICALALLKK